MLRTNLLHPELLDALASLGHGSRVLIADGNFPFRTEAGPNARIVYLNLAPGLLAVDQVLEVLVAAVPVESAVMMQSPTEVPVQEVFREMLGAGVEVDHVDRAAFYEQVRAADTGLIVATGERRTYANVLLTIGIA
ncbi:L-fucose mutarotase [Microbacterium foliorum]|uniref:RbsD/FucU family protein n=1 Tax=Microbacterium foliorum TaxID=104336 RepID=UPI00209E7091|nr:RbsD/FucU family protein [Microbacterium foliorum]MCP1428172.1 L-fucose mutarotase [Microbacterium foliorum]